MTRRLASLILCGAVAVLGPACATKRFVQEQISGTESKLTQQITATETNLTERAHLQEAELRETAERARESRLAIDAADQRVRGLDARVGEVNALAGGAKARAELATTAARDAEARLSQRIASRNRYRLVDTKFVYFDSGQTEIRSQDVNELEELAKALKDDSNAVLELQGFADSRGSDRFNRELARERVETVVSYLVQRQGIELRQLRAIAMGKVALGPGEKASPETLAQARRVDIRLLTPWSSWEDTQAQIDQGSAPEAVSALPIEAEPMDPPRAVPVDTPAPGRLREFLRTITPEDLGW